MRDICSAIESRALPEPNSGCWLWTGVDTGDGYVRASICGQFGFVHRISYRAFKGDIPDGMLVCHKCDVRCCVNPAHLELGTQAKNMADRSDRRLDRLGLTHEVRREIFLSGQSKASLARQHGVSRTTIRTIQRDRAQYGKARLWERVAASRESKGEK